VLGDVNCSDFPGWRAAQDFFLVNGGPAADPFGLDADGDGIACESLPGAPGNAATATALAQAPTATATASASSTPTATAPPTATATLGTPSPTATVDPLATATPVISTATPSPTPLPPTPTSTGTPTPLPNPGSVRYEDNSSAVSYGSGWTQILDASASAGHYRRSQTVGSSATFTVTSSGAPLVWAAIRGPAAGRADLALDGVFLRTVDLYAPQIEYGFGTAVDFPSGRHTLRVTVRGDHDPLSTGTEVTVDYFELIEPVGGADFSIQRGAAGLFDAVIARWAGGTAQDSYLLLRITPSGVVALPPAGQTLAATATSYTDVGLLVEPLTCYLLLMLREGAVIASSDLLCTLARVRSGQAPVDFTMWLSQSAQARLSWAAPAGSAPTGYVVLVLGGEPRAVPLGVGQTVLVDETGGGPTCYVVLTVVDGEIVGNTDALCGVPGLARV
jgi:hypothetical protein